MFTLQRSLPAALAASLAAAAVLWLATSVVRASEEQVEPETTPAEQLAQMEAAVGTTRGELAKHPERAELWQMLLQQEGMLAHVRDWQREEAGASVLPDERKRHMQEVSARVLDEWQRARPQDAQPEFLRARQREQAQGAGLDDQILALLPRYPDDPWLLERAHRVLTERGDVVEAGELVEAFAARHPQSPVPWQLRYRALDGSGQTQRADELLLRWASAGPPGYELVQAWLWGRLAAAQPERTLELMQQFLATRPSDEQALGACGQLLQMSSELRQRGRACLETLAAETASEATRQTAREWLAQAAARDGDLEAGLAALRPEQRLSAVLDAARQQANDCGELLRLAGKAIDLLPTAGENSAWSVASVLIYCRNAAGTLEPLQRLVAVAPAAELPGVVRTWGIRGKIGTSPVWRNERHASELADAVAERRLASPTEVGAWEASALALDLAGRGTERQALLDEWLRSGPQPLPAETLVEYARGRFFAGDTDAAVAALQAALRPGHDSRLAAALVEILLMARRFDEVEAFGAALLERDPPLAEGHLYLARAAAVQERAGAAVEHYRAYLGAGGHDVDAGAEYAGVVLRSSGEAGFRSAVAEICAQERLRGAGATADGCSAALVARFLGAEAASRDLSMAAAKSPQNAVVLEKLAREAAQARQWDVAVRSFRELLELQPGRDEIWLALAQAEASRGASSAQLDALTAEAARAVGHPAGGLLRLAGGAWLAQGEARTALDRLLAARDLSGWYSPELESELARGYELVANEVSSAGAPAAATRAPAPPASATPPRGASGATRSPADVVRRADRLLAGIDGTVDGAAAVQLLATAARAGDPVSALRLATVLQLESGNVRRNAARAGDLARDSVAAVRERALAGDPVASGVWGLALLSGTGVPAHPVAAAPFLEGAAAAGEPWAIHSLAWMRQSGTGVARDVNAARAGYERTAQLGHAASMRSLALLLLSGQGRTPDAAAVAAGERWLRDSATRGLASAQGILGSALVFGRYGIAARVDEGLVWLEKSAAVNPIESGYNLASALLTGIAGRRDAARAVELLRASYAAGNGVAAEQLAFLHAAGIGVQASAGEASRWREAAASHGLDGLHTLIGAAPRAEPAARRFLSDALAAMAVRADAGDVAANAMLAAIYSLGVGVETDPQRAIAYAQRAPGDREALRVLAFGYAHGNGGLPEDAARAAELFHQCAELGNSFCAMWYGQRVRDGKGVPADAEAGERWLERAAEAGNRWALNDLMRRYDWGTSGKLEVDEAKGRRWREKAAQLGDQTSIGWLIYRGLPVPPPRS